MFALLSLLASVSLSAALVILQRESPTGDELPVVAGRDLMSGENNVCVGGHLVPEFFLLGAQKAASTEFIELFRTAKGVVTVDPEEEEFESHFFQQEREWVKGKDWWLSKYPTCSTEVRQVAFDKTPTYLGLPTVVIPRLQQIYGEQSHNLKFAVILRDPLTRSHSAFHYFQHEKQSEHDPQDNNAKQLCLEKYREGPSSGFDKYAMEFLDGQDTCWIFGPSNYTKYLDDWLPLIRGLTSRPCEIFAFKQVIAPDLGRMTPVEYVWHELGLAGEKPWLSLHANSGSHASFESEVDTVLLGRLRAYLEQKTMDSKAVARVILKNGERPFGFDGTYDLTNLTQWLESNW